MSQKDVDFTFVIPNTRWHREGDGRYWNHIPYPEGILTAVLRRNGFTVNHIDANVNNYSEDELFQQVEKKAGKVVGISALSVEYRDSVHKTMGIIKMAKPSSKTVLGGVYPSISPEVAKKASNQNSDLAHVLETVTKQAIETVKKTPEMLKVLADADVVDSGGYGIAVLLSGAVDYLTNNSDGSIDIEIPSTSTSNLLRVKGDFLDDIREEIWGYCTVFAIKGDGLNVTNIRKYVSNLGKSTVVAGDDTLVKIHSHMEDPGPLISYGSTLGILSNIDIKNMDEQTGDWVQEQQKDLVPDSNNIKTNISIVAVVSGAGLINLMNSLTDNSTYVVDGDHTKNPSVQELLTTVENTETKNVIILPNNKNILNKAIQVKILSEKKIEIVPTLSVQSGISCLFVFDKSCGLEENTTNISKFLLYICPNERNCYKNYWRPV